MRTSFEFETHWLNESHALEIGQLPKPYRLNADQFEELWEMHPDEYDEIHLHGRMIKTPRWQQAFGRDYHFTGLTHQAVPVPEILQPLVDVCRETIHPGLNGVLAIWYDSDRRHYIGRHRDSTKNMVEGAPIVTVSLGAERRFRLRPWKGSGFQDFPLTDGTVCVMPYETNLAWTHEVPFSKKFAGRRISITLRAFV